MRRNKTAIKSSMVRVSNSATPAARRSPIANGMKTSFISAVPSDLRLTLNFV